MLRKQMPDSWNNLQDQVPQIKIGIWNETSLPGHCCITSREYLFGLDPQFNLLWMEPDAWPYNSLVQPCP